MMWQAGHGDHGNGGFALPDANGGLAIPPKVIEEAIFFAVQVEPMYLAQLLLVSVVASVSTNFLTSLS